MVVKTFRHGTPLSPPVQERLRALIVEIGEYEAAKKIGVGYSSIARAAAGMGLRRGTAGLIEMKLEAIKTANGTKPAKTKGK
jgi:hypothetical protein